MYRGLLEPASNYEMKSSKIERDSIEGDLECHA